MTMMTMTSSHLEHSSAAFRTRTSNKSEIKEEKKCLQLCVHHIRGFKGSIFRACGKRQHFFVTKTCRCSSIYSFRMQYSKHKIQASFFSRRITRRPKPNSPAYTGSKPGFRLETPARKGYPGLGPATGPKNGHKPS